MDKAKFVEAVSGKVVELGGRPSEAGVHALYETVQWEVDPPHLDDRAAIRWCAEHEAEIRFHKGSHPCVSIMRAKGFPIGCSGSDLQDAIRGLKKRNTPWHPEKCPDCGGLCKETASFDPPKWARVGAFVRCKEGRDRDRVGKLLEVSPHGVYVGAPDFNLAILSRAVEWGRWEPLHG